LSSHHTVWLIPHSRGCASQPSAGGHEHEAQVADQLCGAHGLSAAAQEYGKPDRFPVRTQEFMQAEAEFQAVEAGQWQWQWHRHWLLEVLASGGPDARRGVVTLGSRCSHAPPSTMVSEAFERMR
jgi:hypothetical protein